MSPVKSPVKQSFWFAEMTKACVRSSTCAVIMPRLMTEAAGHANQTSCPYHGWTYSLEGELKGTPDFSEVSDFDRTSNGLVPIEIATWENWIFARLDRGQVRHLSGSIENFLEPNLIEQINSLALKN